MTTVNLPDGTVLHAEQEMIPVSSMLGESKYDPTWSWTDPRGHEHHIVDGWPGVTDAAWVTLYTYWCYDCRDDHDHDELRCVLCDVEIPTIPRVTVTPPGMLQHIRGMVSYWIEYPDGRTESLTEEQFRAFWPRPNEESH